MEISFFGFGVVDCATMTNHGFLPSEAECPDIVDVRIFLSGAKVRRFIMVFGIVSY